MTDIFLIQPYPEELEDYVPRLRSETPEEIAARSKRLEEFWKGFEERHGPTAS